MDKLNFVSNPRICVFIEDNDDVLYLTPDQIPSVIIPALTRAAHGETILSCSIFVKEEYSDSVHALTVLWDGVCVIQKCFKLFGDGSYDYIERDHSTVWNQI